MNGKSVLVSPKSVLGQAERGQAALPNLELIRVEAGTARKAFNVKRNRASL